MFSSREKAQSPLAAAARRPSVAQMADRVCEATRQAALEGAEAAMSIMASESPALPDASRDIANRALARAAIMQTAFDRFLAVCRGGHWASVRTANANAMAGPSTWRKETADQPVVMFKVMEAQRAKDHRAALRRILVE